MRLTVQSKELQNEKSGILALGLFTGKDRAPPAFDPQTRALDDATGGGITAAYRTGTFRGSRGEVHVLDGPGKTRILVVGLGKQEKADLETLRVVAAAAIKRADAMEEDRLVTTLHTVPLDPDPTTADKAEAVAVGLVLGRYRFERFKAKDDDRPAKKEVKTTLFATRDAAETRNVKEAVARGQILAEGQWVARDLGNTPSNVATPRWMANEAKRLARTHGLKATVLGPAEMKKHKMGGLLGVAQGSEEPPRLVVLEHRPKQVQGAPYQTVALVGKGITFDTGGISLKPGPGMELMKYDKCGACAVIGVMTAVARLELPVHVVAVVALTENMPSGKAYKPGDIITMANGKTVEILNTDAEGRMILGDALWYAQRFKPDAIVDVATLTGAVDIALGSHYSGLMAHDAALVDMLRKAGEGSGEHLWHLPLGDGYQDQIKGHHSDLVNIGGRSAGACTAGQFLSNFVDVDKVKWAHLDIAGTAWVESNAPYTPKGCTGVGVRVLGTFLRDLTS